MAISVGQNAPDFTLFDTEKQKVSLHDFKGKNVVLLFYPFAFSGVCDKEVCEMHENLAAYDKLNAKVIGISVDSLFTQKQFKKHYNLGFTLLSDFNKEVCPLYDSLEAKWGGVEYKGVAKRASFVIDKNGVIRYAEILPSPGDYPNMQAIKSAVESLN